jgi:uncharacterized tellurite resistance protein B-like protein
MVRSLMSEIELWEKYRNESKQTICIIGVLILSAKLCKADGHFSIDEEEEILKIIPHDPQQKRILMRILEEGANDLNPISFHANKIKILIGDDQPDFLEFIVAVLYRLAHSDHVYHVDEDQAIRDVAKIFGITKTSWQFTKETFVKFFKYKIFNNKQNA